jgi:tRNA threonylcarbamoyladenosine biosynthesis protein TsaE
MEKYFSKSETDTINIAEQFGKTLKGCEVIILDGDLGAGKTHFAKGVAKALKVTDTVTSPTFTLHNIYKGERLTMNHFDFYRITEEEAEAAGLDEFIGRDGTVSLIEWADNAPNVLPKKVIKVTITKQGEQGREIIIER